MPYLPSIHWHRWLRLSIHQQIIDLAQQHNILGLRELVKTLEAQNTHQEFYAQLRPYLSNYRFKPLVEWLKSLGD